MAAPDREPSRLPATGMVAVLLLLASAVLVSQFPLVSSRPESPDKVRARSVSLQDVDARLWQDPFSAAVQHQDDKDASTPDHEARHDPWHLKAQVLDRDADGGVTIFGATIFGGPYAEDSEHRRRTRYAVLSGLNSAGFVPDDAEHLGYFALKPDLEDRQGLLAPPSLVPFEWLSRAQGTPRHVLLLWLNETALGTHPLFKIARVLDAVDPTRARRTGGVYARSCSAGRRRPVGTVKIVGPSGSGTLRDMIAEARVPDQNWCLENVEFYAATPTASDTDLVGAGETASDVLYRTQGIALLRTILPDAALLRALVDELRTRGVDSVRAQPEGRQHVALIAEWDTLYSQTLGEALATVICSELNSGGPPAAQTCRAGLEDPRQTWIHRFSYLRGLDGALATRPPGQNDDAARKGDTPRFGLEEVRERAELGSQFDYLRRLADRMREKDAELRAEGAGFAAVGVLGSDLYDKLLVLQAVRTRFPKATFFTTDLDARLLHPPDFKWTRNLLVVSAYGLRLQPDLQRHIPPFRDSYQTSVFLAVQLAFDSERPPLSDPRARREAQERLATWIRPRIFEIGRTEALDLSAKPTTATASCRTAWACSDPHPEPPPLFPAPSWPMILASLAVVLIGGMLLLLSSSHVRWVATDGTALLARTGRTWAWVVALAAMAATAAVVLGGRAILQEERGEPFRVLEGVSMWPTEFLRALVAVLAVIFLIQASRRVHAITDRLSATYFPGCAPSGRAEPWSWRRIFAGRIRAPAAVDDATRIWDEYLYQITPRHQLARVLAASALFYLLGMGLIVLLGAPHVPHRGNAILIVDRVILRFACVPLVLLLTFYVVDAIRLCDKYTQLLGLPSPTGWPREVRERVGDTLGLDRTFADRVVGHWIDIRVIALWTTAIGPLIYYPFIAIGLMIVARSALFDNFDVPPSLVVVFALSLLYAAMCAYTLRQVAERGRQAAIEALTRHMIAAKGKPEERALADQLDVMIREIADLREGAFGPLFRQEFMRAALVPLSGAGGIALLEYVILGR